MNPLARPTLRAALSLSAALLLPSCYAAGASDEAYSESNGMGDLTAGEVVEEAGARNPAAWMHATRCKDIPNLPALAQPEITVSLDGLTLHLRDRAGGYDRVFPIGVGTLGGNRESITPTSDTAPMGLFYTGTNTTEVRDGTWGYYYPCRVWLEDNGSRTPVFAGLPFIRLAGPPTAGYGIHGPIDNYTAENGGTLRRGYVSHGCIRMAASDIVEVYARIRGRARVPVRIQKAVERDAQSRAVDLPSRWIGAECGADADCNYAGGRCRVPSGGGRGTCTMTCTRTCPDRAGEAPTFCAAEGTTGQGICVPAASTTFNNTCARYGTRLTLATNVSRPDRSARANVCRPAM